MMVDVSNRRRPVRPPRLPGPPSLPRGPKLYQQPKGWPKRQNVFVDIPGTFTGSAPEWRAYCSLWINLNLPGSPRNSGPDFRGYPHAFAYQDPFEGGRIGGPGGQVFDFTVFFTPKGQPLVIRVQGSYWHYGADAEKQARDFNLLTRAAQFYRIEDVWDYELMADDTGESAVKVIKAILLGFRSQSPITAGINVNMQGTGR